MDLTKLFYPESVAVVGASPEWGKGKVPYYQIFVGAGYKGRVYPVNPAYKEINGVKVYPTLDELPEPVDLAVVSVPVRAALENMEAAGRRGVRFVHFFTSGFSELGNKELEEAMLRVTRETGSRIVGPNCLGVMNTDSGVTFNPFIRKLAPRGVAFLGQSGGVTDNFLRLAQARGISISKAVSFGNQIDVGLHDFLHYLATDEATLSIGVYVEDVKNGPAFLSALKEAAAAKPVFILKGGSSEMGARAAASHTGAMAGNSRIFSCAVRQCGAIEVGTFEQLVDVAMITACTRMPEGPRVGFVGAGGGTSVLFTDLATRRGLVLPELSATTRARIQEKIPQVNTSTENPVDLGAFGMDVNVSTHALKALDGDENVDVIVAYFSLDFIAVFQKGQIETSPRIIADTASKLQKPMVSIFSKHGEDNPEIEAARLRVYSIFREAQLPLFTTLQEGGYAIARILDWQKRRARLASAAGTQGSQRG